MNIVLVTMPWPALEMPSLPIGLLRSRVGVCVERHTVADYFGNLRWVEYLLQVSEGELGPAKYAYIADFGLFHGMGDWIFASALYGDEDWGRDDFMAYLREHQVDGGASLEMRRHATAFTDLAVEEILAEQPDLVGFTTTFMQNVPSLAVARRIKERRSDVVTVFGGGNCDGPMGAALHRSFDFVDYVVRGEGEIAFVELLDALTGHGTVQAVEGLCWRSRGGPVANPERTRPVPVGEIPCPDYDSWFRAYEASPVKHYVEPTLVLEAARGCWWGERHQCTFCGLNGSMIKFRSKPPTVVLDEIDWLVRRHETLDLVMVENIMDPGYLKSLLPDIEKRGWDLRIQYEVKANLKREHIRQLRAAGVVQIQPGIESLNSRVLDLMDKGVHAVHNVVTLRESEEVGLTVSWNYLYGFPNERADDYWPVIRQLPALVHLQPPSAATRIALERFSPHFDRPELGFTERAPARLYRHVYDLPASVLGQLVFLFDTPDRGISGEVEEALSRQIGQWRERYHDSSLTCEAVDGAVVIKDRRVGWEARDHVLERPEETRAYELLATPRTLPGLRDALGRDGMRLDTGALAAWVDALCAAGLVFAEGGRMTSLATRRVPIRMGVDP